MFFKTCGKYTTYFLIAKKYFSSALSFYFRYTYTIGSAKDQRRISEGKSASWRSRVCDEVSAKYKRLITIKKTEKYYCQIGKLTNWQIRKNNQKKFVFQRKVLSLYYDSEDNTNIKQKG